MHDSEAPITELLHAWENGDPRALERLTSELYGELKRLAGSYLRRERPGHTLQPTALAHEAFLRLYRQRRIEWRDRGHFFALAATWMRRILVDHARRHRMARRHGKDEGDRPEAATEVSAPLRAMDLVALDHALDHLRRLSPNLAQVVELRFFAGLTLVEAGEVLEVSPRTVERRWAAARLWLYRELAEDPCHAA
ncbi:MAG: ECF-type sigma factor [Holophagales bacterium]|nr:ECF-type sigma factor [Holophagales bacterium]